MKELGASERTAFVLRHFEGMCIEDEPCPGLSARRGQAQRVSRCRN